MTKSIISTSVLLVISLFLMCLYSCKEEQPIINTAEELEISLQNSYSKSKFAGFSVAVVKKGNIVFQESFGDANVAESILLTNQTAMNIASVSKLFVGVAVMKAIEQGHFTLETPINEILPFQVINPNAKETLIRVKHLVTHTSGILDDENTYLSNYSILQGEDLTTPMAERMLNELNVKSNGEVLSLADFMYDYFAKDGALYKVTNFSNSAAGENYRYCNIASALAAYLVEIKTGMSFEEYTKNEIFTPLHMENTAWKLTDLNREEVSLQYWDRNNPLPFYTMATYPDGSLITSIEDLTLFMLEMMKGKANQSNLLLSSDSYQVLFEKKFEANKKPTEMSPKEDNYGVFWVWSTSGRIGHSGGDLGTTCFFGINPDTQTGSILMLNSNVEEIEDDGATAEILAEIVGAYRSFEEVK
ncbi:beta-lactamase family protein [Marivirga sp. S37H4]|uniref:Beta-lactamase family protein n=1 Tax=Marivirga aurantiaca TaxID=2802615 RepID=A0A934WYR0_9BACT|nr:serine hydrolase domain-containing protein [Marivirga aurantiaca]MBK6265653.1 beta-lactamase family protein [Marivirga aurantiaca]